MYILLMETTKWEYPNCIYIVTENKQRCIGYFKNGYDTPELFKKPVSFDTRYRTFKNLGKIEEGL